MSKKQTALDGFNLPETFKVDVVVVDTDVVVVVVDVVVEVEVAVVVPIVAPDAASIFLFHGTSFNR